MKEKHSPFEGLKGKIRTDVYFLDWEEVRRTGEVLFSKKALGDLAYIYVSGGTPVTYVDGQWETEEGSTVSDEFVELV